MRRSIIMTFLLVMAACAPQPDKAANGPKIDTSPADQVAAQAADGIRRNQEFRKHMGFPAKELTDRQRRSLHVGSLDARSLKAYNDMGETVSRSRQNVLLNRLKAMDGERKVKARSRMSSEELRRYKRLHSPYKDGRNGLDRQQ